MPFVIIGAVAYTAIGFAVRSKFFPREKIQYALAWPALLLTARGK